MASLLVQQKVKSFEEWKKVFDSVVSLRSSYGGRESQVFRNADDPNNVTVMVKWDSVANARKWAQSPEMKEAMQKAGVEGIPAINILNEA